jgi:hypothetical protein
LFRVHYIHLWNCHNETPLCWCVIYANTNSKNLNDIKIQIDTYIYISFCEHLKKGNLRYSVVFLSKEKGTRRKAERVN